VLRILAWNLMHGGGPTRTAEAAILLAHARADIAVLAEFRAARGSQILQSLADCGLTHAATAPPSRGGNTIAIASRWSLAHAHAPPCAPHGRVLACEVPALNLSVLGVHIPDESAVSARDGAWAATLAWARSHAERAALIAGDFNTSRTGIDPARDAQTCEHCLGVLESLGYRDAWRQAGCPQPAVSWFGPCGERQRLDAIYVSRAWADRVDSVRYDASCVGTRVSDHAMLRVGLKAEVPAVTSPGWMSRVT
jgi:endonuclease/exonuclease/phosphatase family metal-dependent hydrolase